MKKMKFILLLLIIGSICMMPCSENPYIGEYESSDNTILELRSNNYCTIINNKYKEVFYTNGKYDIKDNKISITFGDNEPNYYGASIINGKFEGSNIKITSSLNSKDYIYIKK